jgi:hypothetical protein
MVFGRRLGVLGWVLFIACCGNGAASLRAPTADSTVQGESAGRASGAMAGSGDEAPAMDGDSDAGSKAGQGPSQLPSAGATAGRGPAEMRAGSGPAGRGGASAAGSAGHSGASAQTGKLYSDDFEAGNLTKPSWIDADPDLGGKWMVLAADSGKVLAQTASVSDWVIAAGGDYRWSDQVVEARVRITSDPGKAGIFARLRDTRNYYFLYIDGGSNLVLRKRVDNSSSDVQKVKVKSEANTWYTLKLSVIGDKIQGYLDGNMLVSGSDGSISTGGIGVGTSDCTAEFDDVVVNGS